MGIQNTYLAKRGFRNVFGMTEIKRVEGKATSVTIGKGKPFTWDYNQGVTAAYDHEGDPWVRRGRAKMNNEFERGAYVPLSNDGGWAISQMFPTPEEAKERVLADYYTPDEFLKWLNATELAPEQFTFARNVDMIIVGTCSAGLDGGHNSITKNDAHTPNPYYFERFPAFKDSKVVLLIAECCGPYTSSFMQQLRMYPHIEEWINPSVSDYCERPTAERVFNDLKRLEVIVPVKA